VPSRGVGRRWTACLGTVGIRRHRVDGVGRIKREVAAAAVLAVSDAWCGADVGRAWVPIRLGTDSRDRSQVSCRATDAGTGRSVNGSLSVLRYPCRRPHR